MGHSWGEAHPRARPTTTDMEDGFVKWQGEAASTTVAADAASC